MRYRLTRKLEEEIVQYIRAGGFDWVAAEAAGVPRAVLENWLRRGALERRQPYLRFYEIVMQAKAQSRLRAEIDARAKDPRFWLRHGPGREMPNQPGWTNPAKPAIHPHQGSGTPLDSPEWGRIYAIIYQALSPFPEARRALAEALQQTQKDGD